MAMVDSFAVRLETEGWGPGVAKREDTEDRKQSKWPLARPPSKMKT